MTITSCCKHLLKRYGDRRQAVLCKSWILPLRLAVLLSLFGHLIWQVCHPVVFYSVAIIFIHGAVALLLFAECRRSAQYHRTIEEFDRREALWKKYPPDET